MSTTTHSSTWVRELSFSTNPGLEQKTVPGGLTNLSFEGETRPTRSFELIPPYFLLIGAEPSPYRKKPQIKIRFQPIAGHLGNRLYFRIRKESPLSNEEAGNKIIPCLKRFFSPLPSSLTKSSPKRSVGWKTLRSVPSGFRDSRQWPKPIRRGKASRTTAGNYRRRSQIARPESL